MLPRKRRRITFLPKTVLDQVTLSPRGEELCEEELLDEALQETKEGKTKALDDEPILPIKE
ncbi:MAG: hypothetical protein WC081_02480 [Candidatus Ratteibacteria bacterium]|jgi:hypothetical protein